jgi:hypothetical protein
MDLEKRTDQPNAAEPSPQETKQPSHIEKPMRIYKETKDTQRQKLLGRRSRARERLAFHSDYYTAQIRK